MSLHFFDLEHCLKVGLIKIWTGLFWEVQGNRRSNNGYKLVCRRFVLDIWFFFFFFTGREVKRRDQEPTELVVSILSSIRTPNEWTRLSTASFNWSCFVQGLPYMIPESLPAWIILWFCHQHREQQKGDSSIGNFTSSSYSPYSRAREDQGGSPNFLCW